MKKNEEILRRVFKSDKESCNQLQLAASATSIRLIKYKI